MSLCELTAHALHEKLKNREITAVELAESVYARIDAVEPHVKGYLTLTKELGLRASGSGGYRFSKRGRDACPGGYPDRD